MEKQARDLGSHICDVLCLYFMFPYPKRICLDSISESVLILGISTNAGQQFTESKSINLSLSTLGKVIQCLSADKPAHIPYRESKLTRILQVS